MCESEDTFLPMFCSVCDKQLPNGCDIYCSSGCRHADSQKTSEPNDRRESISRRSSGITISSSLAYPSVLDYYMGPAPSPRSVPDLAISPSDDEMSDYSLPPSPGLIPTNKMTSINIPGKKTNFAPLPRVEYFSLTATSAQ